MGLLEKYINGLFDLCRKFMMFEVEYFRLVFITWMSLSQNVSVENDLKLVKMEILGHFQ